MKKVVFTIVFLTMMLAFSTTAFAIVFDVTTDEPPEIYNYLVGTTGEYRNLSDTSVCITGYVKRVYSDWLATSGACLMGIGNLEYWEEGSEDIIETPTVYNYSGTSVNITEYLTDLKPSTTYYYKASDGGEIKSFTTLAEPQPKIMPVFEETKYGMMLNVKHQSINYSTDKFYVAFYKDDEFIGIKSNEYEFYPRFDFDYAKVMVWNEDTMSPVTTPEIVYNTTN